MGKLAERRNHRFTQENLSAYLDGELSERDAGRVRAHLADCQVCQRELLELQATIRSLSELPRASLPRSFALSPEAVAGQRRIRRLDASYGALRTVGVAVTLALVLLLSGDQLLARGIVPLAGGKSAAPQVERAVDAVPVEKQGEAEVRLQALTSEAEIESEASAMVLPPAEPEGEGEVEAPLAMALATTPLPEQEQVVAGGAQVVEETPPMAEATATPQREKPATPAPTTAAAEAEDTPPPPPQPTPQETAPAQGMAGLTPGAGFASALTREAGAEGEQEADQTEAAPEAAPERTEPSGGGGVPAPSATPTRTPTPEPTATTEAPAPSATPTPTDAPPTATPTPGAPPPTVAIAETVAAAAPAIETPAIEAFALEQAPTVEDSTPPSGEAVAMALQAPDLAAAPPAEAAGLASTAPEDSAQREITEELVASPPATVDETAIVREVVRQAAGILGGIALMTFGGLLWVAHERRL